MFKVRRGGRETALGKGTQMSELWIGARPRPERRTEHPSRWTEENRLGTSRIRACGDRASIPSGDKLGHRSRKPRPLGRGSSHHYIRKPRHIENLRLDIQKLVNLPEPDVIQPFKLCLVPSLDNEACLWLCPGNAYQDPAAILPVDPQPVDI